MESKIQPAEWRGWDDTLFFANLQKTFGKNTGGKRLSPIEQIAQGLAKLEFNFDANSPASWGDLCVAIDKLLSEAGTDKPLYPQRNTRDS